MTQKTKLTLLLLTAIPLLVCGCNKNNENLESDRSSVNSSTESITDEMHNRDHSDHSDDTDETSELIADGTVDDDASEGDIGVNYIESDELVQKEYYASADDINLNRPSTLTGSEVFVGWVEQDVVSQIGNGALDENESISLTVEAIDISDTENAIYNDTVYVSREFEYIEIPVIIGGNMTYRIYQPTDYSAASIMAITDYNPKEILGSASSITMSLGELQGILDIAAQGGNISKEYVRLNLATVIASQMGSINEVMDNSKYYSFSMSRSTQYSFASRLPRLDSNRTMLPSTQPLMPVLPEIILNGSES